MVQEVQDVEIKGPVKPPQTLSGLRRWECDGTKLEISNALP